jgi:D-threo-aldose 1-dehydrogenase
VHTLIDHPAWRSGILDLCIEKGVGVVLGGVFQSGILGGKSDKFSYQEAPMSVRTKVKDVGRICERHGVPLRTAALQFPLAHAAISTMIVGASSRAEVDDCTLALHQPIPDELWTDLQESGVLPSNIPTPKRSDTKLGVYV